MTVWDRNLTVRLLGEFLVGISFWMFFPFLTVYFSNEFGKNIAGLLMMGSMLLSAIVNFFGGFCADHFGRKKMMTLSALMQAGLMILFAFSASPWLDSPILGFICFTLLGVAGVFYNPASQAMVADLVAEEHRATVFSIFYTMNNLTVIVGPLIGSLLFEKYRFELYLASAIVLFFLTVLLKTMLRETLPIIAKKTHADGEKWYGFLHEQLGNYQIIFQNKIFFLFIIAGIFLCITYMQLDILFPVYTEHLVPGRMLLSFSFPSFAINLGILLLMIGFICFLIMLLIKKIPSIFKVITFALIILILFFYRGLSHITVIQIKHQFWVNAQNIFGLLIAENGFIVVVFTILITKLLNRYSEGSLFTVSSVLYAVAMLYAGSIHDVSDLFISMAIFTFAEIMTAGIQSNFVARISPEHLRGQYFAAASLRWTIGRTVAPVALIFAGSTSFFITFVILAIVALLSAVIYYILFQQAEKQYPAKQN